MSETEYEEYNETQYPHMITQTYYENELFLSSLSLHIHSTRLDTELCLVVVISWPCLLGSYRRLLGPPGHLAVVCYLSITTKCTFYEIEITLEKGIKKVGGIFHSIAFKHISQQRRVT